MMMKSTFITMRIVFLLRLSPRSQPEAVYF